MLEIDYLIRYKDLSTAFNVVEDLGQQLKDEGADVYQRIRLLSCKASIFAKAGKPELGFSMALRAANASLKARILPAAWEALALLCGVLITFDESQPTITLLEAITPQASWISAISLERQTLTGPRRWKDQTQCSAHSSLQYKLTRTWLSLGTKSRDHGCKTIAWSALITASNAR